MTVLSCDTAIRSSQEVFAVEQVRLHGGGGTNMGVGLRAAVALRPRPEVIVVLTDGQTPGLMIGPQLKSSWRSLERARQIRHHGHAQSVSPCPSPQARDICGKPWNASVMTSQSHAIQALSVAVSRRIPVLLWGGPGTGKSSMIRSLGAALDLPVVTVIASLREPADFAGLPVVSDDGSIRLAEPSWARKLAQAESGILFLDEITTAPPAVQAALLRVVLERVVGDVELPPGIAVIAAANPPEVAAGGWDLSPPLANRFCHIDWPVDSDRYLEALSAGWGNGGIELPPESRSDKSSVQVRSALAGFLRSRPTLLYAMPEDATSSGRRGRARAHGIWPRNSGHVPMMLTSMLASHHASFRMRRTRCCSRITGVAARGGPTRPRNRTRQPWIVQAP